MAKHKREERCDVFGRVSEEGIWASSRPSVVMRPHSLFPYIISDLTDGTDRFS